MTVVMENALKVKTRNNLNKHLFNIRTIILKHKNEST